MAIRKNHLIIFFIVLFAVLGYFFFFKDKKISGIKNEAGFSINSDKYQAVFLSNNQVYFGKLETAGDYLELTDIYYLRLSQDLQNQKLEVNDYSLPSQLVLIKLGKELHGPNDTMFINKNQVLFIEELKDDSTVVKAINEYNTNKQPNL